MTTKILMVLLLAAGALSFGPGAAAASDAELEQLVVEMAESPAQHAALARHYRAEAAEARAEQERHRQMADTYGGLKLSQRTRMKAHCDEIAARYGELATEYDALAQLHQEQSQ